MTTTHGSVHMAVEHRHLAGWANGLAAVAAILAAVGLTVLAIVGFNASDEDFNGWKGVVVSIGLFGGMFVSVVAFATAVVAKLRHERWALLWFPLLFGPAFIISFPFWFD